MPSKKEYTSFEEINLDLKIRSLTKEIALQKTLQSLENTKVEFKKSIAPFNIAKTLVTNVSSIYNTDGLKVVASTLAFKLLSRWLKNKFQV